jgi:hypothetical protein
MTEEDKSLLKQMIHAGRFNTHIYDLLCEYNAAKTKEMIKEMGTKWCCHPANATKRLDTPLPILADRVASKILRKK